MTEPPRPTAAASCKRTHLCLLLAVAVAAVAFRFHGIARQGVRFVDEGEYCQFGLALLDRVPGQIIDKPGHALLVYLSYKLFGMDMASPLRLSALLGCGTVALGYCLARILYGSAAGLVAASALATMPLCLFYQRSAMSDGNYLFCSFVGLTLCALALRPGFARACLWAAAGGVAFGFGFCVNPSTVLFAAAAGAALVLVRRKQGAVALVALAGAAVASRALLNHAMGPYINWKGVNELYSFHAKWVLEFHPTLWFARTLWAYAGAVLVLGGIAGAGLAARRRTPGDVLALVLAAGLLLFSARLSIRFPRLYLPLAVPLVLLTARLAAEGLDRLPRWRPWALAAVCIVVAAPGAVESRRFVRLHSGYDTTCRMLRAEGVRRGLTTHSWWTFQAFTRRRFAFVSETLAGILRRPAPSVAAELRRMADRGCSHLVIDYLFWLHVTPEVRDGLRALLERCPPTFTVPNPIVAHEATALEDGQLPALDHEPLAHSIYVYRLRDLPAP